MVKLLIVSCRSPLFLIVTKIMQFYETCKRTHGSSHFLQQQHKIFHARVWRNFIFGLALAERQRAAPISDQTCFQHTSVSTCISVLQYLRLSTGVLAYQYWSTEPSVLTRREKNSPQTATRCQRQPIYKLFSLKKRPFTLRKNQKSPISS